MFAWLQWLPLQEPIAEDLRHFAIPAYTTEKARLQHVAVRNATLTVMYHILRLRGATTVPSYHPMVAAWIRANMAAKKVSWVTTAAATTTPPPPPPPTQTRTRTNPK